MEFDVLGMMFDSCVETVDRAVRKVDWLSVVDARVILPLELAQFDFEEPTPSATPDQAVAALKESIENVGFDVTVRMTLHSGRFRSRFLECPADPVCPPWMGHFERSSCLPSRMCG